MFAACFVDFEFLPILGLRQISAFDLGFECFCGKRCFKATFVWRLRTWTFGGSLIGTGSQREISPCCTMLSFRVRVSFAPRSSTRSPCLIMLTRKLVLHMQYTHCEFALATKRAFVVFRATLQLKCFATKRFHPPLFCPLLGIATTDRGFALQVAMFWSDLLVHCSTSSGEQPLNHQEVSPVSQL